MKYISGFQHFNLHISAVKFVRFVHFTDSAYNNTILFLLQIHVQNISIPLISIFRVEMEEPPLVKTAANIFRRFCYRSRDEAVAGILCAGWDEREGGQVRAVFQSSDTL